jgi:hemerythrin
MSTTPQIFPWREAYSVHIPQIDAQHQQLIGLINQLHAAMLQGNGKPALAQILTQLVRYTDSHFSYEESMLRQRGYPGLAAHQAEHQKLKKQVVDLQVQFQAGKLLLTMQVMQFLKEWLANHILSRDMDYAKEMK